MITITVKPIVRFGINYFAVIVNGTEICTTMSIQLANTKAIAIQAKLNSGIN